MNTVELVIRWLAVFGAFALGGWFTGWLMNYLAGSYFKNKRLPPAPAWLARTLGGVAFAAVVYLLSFGTAGFGLGGGGGGLGGSGTTPPDGGKEPAKTKDKDKKEEKKKIEPPPTVGGDTLRVEVLGDAPLIKLGGAKFDRTRRYQIKGKPGVQSLDEVKERLNEMHRASPPLRLVEVVLYLDSPDRQGPPVNELVAHVKDLGEAIKIDFYEPGRRAPVD